MNDEQYDALQATVSISGCARSWPWLTLMASEQASWSAAHSGTDQERLVNQIDWKSRVIRLHVGTTKNDEAGLLG